jgi:AbiU2
MFESKDSEWRITKAKQITKRLVDHAVDILWIAESNAITIYSDKLSKQIPRSYAAHAFNSFCKAMLQIEVVRLSALWDPAADNLRRESIPTVIELIDHPNVLSRLSDVVCAQYPPIAADDDLENGSDPEVINFFRAKHGAERAELALNELKAAIANARALFESDKLKAVRSMRTAKIAHNLKPKEGDVTSIKYGDERAVLSDTLPIIEKLYCWVNGVGFSFVASRKIDQKCNEELWKNCTFSIPLGRSRQGSPP